MLGTKIRAGALQFVLFIGAVIAVLLLTFLILSQTHIFFGKKTGKFIATVKKADLGLQYALGNKLTLNDSVTIPFEGDDGIQLTAIRQYWGVFEKHTVVSTFKKNRFVRTALVGGNNSFDSPALYLQDNERPLIIVGNAKIVGGAQLPKQGIRPGNISGHSYRNSELVYGRRGQSTSQLPAIDSELKNHISNFIGTLPGGTNDVLAVSSKMVFSNSFLEPTKYVYGVVVNLSEVSLTGNIVVKASQRIIVDASSSLTDVILSAPEISIKNGSSGIFQALASQKITVGKNCFLGYPSALVVSNGSQRSQTSRQNRTANIVVAENATIKGVICYLDTNTEQQFSPQVSMNKTSILYGELYCEKNLELKGSVVGSVGTHSFIAMENGSIYQNHLYNGTINSTLLPEQYVGLLAIHKQSKKGVSKWLY